MIVFEPLWKTMAAKRITQYKLIYDYGISRGQLDRIKKNENVTVHTLDILCNILDCEVGDIMEHIKDDNNRFKP